MELKCRKGCSVNSREIYYRVPCGEYLDQEFSYLEDEDLKLLGKKCKNKLIKLEAKAELEVRKETSAGYGYGY